MRKIFGLFVAFCIVTLTACFSPWSGDGEGAITIAFGVAGPGGRVAVTTPEIDGLTHYVMLTGPGGVIRREFTGRSSATIPVVPGAWSIEIRSVGDRPEEYDDSFPERVLRAVGSGRAVVRAGYNAPASIELISAMEVGDHTQLCSAIGMARTDGREKIIFITRSFEVSDTLFIEAGTVNITLASAVGEDVTISRAQGNTEVMFNVEGEGNTLRLGRPGIPGNITIDGDDIAANGSIIKVRGYATLEMNQGVTLTGNRNRLGGAVYVGDRGIFVMRGGVISSNNADFGGGVYVAYNAERFEKTGGVIYGYDGSYPNTADISGDAVFLSGIDDDYYNETVRRTQENPLIWTREEYIPTPPENNVSISRDGEAPIFFAHLEEVLNTITASGAYIVTVYREQELAPRLLTGANITLQGDGAGGVITLASEGSLFTVSSGTLMLENITLQGMGMDEPNIAPLVFVGQSGTLVMNSGAIITGNNNTTSGNVDQGWERLGGGVRVQGTFQMRSGEISGNRSMAAERNVYGEYESSGGGVFVAGGGTFIMGETNSAEVPRIYYNHAGNWGGGGIIVDHGSIFTMHNGVIEDNNAIGGGGGVHVGAHGTNTGGIFVMYGGSIMSNNSSGGGGGVFVNVDTGSRGTFAMNGGTISGNEASGNHDGGGVFVLGDFRMGGEATISNNRANNGGGVSIGIGENAPADGGGIFHMDGGTIYNNRTITIAGVRNGGGVHIGHEGTFNMASGTISANNAVDGGGVFVAGNGTFAMSGGRIEFNNVTNRGGGVFVAADGDFHMGHGDIGNAEIRSNRANARGGGVFVNADGDFGMNFGAAILGIPEPEPQRNTVGVDGQGAVFYFEDGSRVRFRNNPPSPESWDRTVPPGGSDDTIRR